MKRIITKLGMMMAVLLSFLPASAYDFEVDGIYYDVVSLTDFTCEVVENDYEEYAYTGDIVIPEKVYYNNKELVVVGIQEYAFDGCQALTSVTIPNSVRTIGHGAFYECTSLTSVNIPNSVTEIGTSAFAYCKSLTSIALPNSVTEIGKSTFDFCESLTSVTIPNSVTKIGESAFTYCTSLTSVTLPNSVTEIGEDAFRECTSLTSIALSNSLTKIDYSAFEKCNSLTSITIPDSVTEIKSYAFKNCSSLASIKLSNNLEAISVGLFSGCESLSSLTLPGSIQSIRFYIDNNGGWNIDVWTFKYCMSLTNVRIEYNDTWLKFDNYNGHNAFIWPGYDGYISPVESFYIDRKLEYDIELPYLCYYTIGEHVHRNCVHLDKSDYLESITCFATEPPTLGELTNPQYMNVIVKVPEESLEAYQQAEGWKNFWNLQGFDTSGVEGVGSTSAKCVEVGRYNLNGQKVGEGYDGIVIVRYSDGSTKKMVQK